MAINRDKRGQAMVETAICIFFIVMVISTLVTFGPIILAKLDLQGNLRAEAGRKAVAGALGATPTYIGAWDVGEDKIPFTGDDKSRGGSGAAAAGEIAGYSATSGDMWAYPQSKTSLIGTMYDLNNVSTLPVTFAEAKDSETVDLDDFAAKYIFGNDTTKVEYKVLMPMCGGLL